MTSQPPSYRGYRFPSEIISHAVWLYYRFGLSFRDVEDLLAERGITVTYEAIRLWCRTFGLNYARRLRRRRGRQGDTWYLDGHCQVDEKLVDQPPRYWARARRDPAMLGIKNSRQPQLDNTRRNHRRARLPRGGGGRHQPVAGESAPRPRHAHGRDAVLRPDPLGSCGIAAALADAGPRHGRRLGCRRGAHRVHLMGIVKLRLTAVFDAQHGGPATS